VTLADGTQLNAERVLSAADRRFTLSLLPGTTTEDLARAFKPGDLSDQLAQVNLGVAQDFSSQDGPMTSILPEPFEAAGRQPAGSIRVSPCTTSITILMLPRQARAP